MYPISANCVIQFILTSCEFLVCAVCYVLLNQFFNVIKPEKLLVPARLPMFVLYIGLTVVLVREMTQSGKTKFTLCYFIM